MTKKVIVSKEWHERAMNALLSAEETSAFVAGLKEFLFTEISPEQQRTLEEKIYSYLENINVKGR